MSNKTVKYNRSLLKWEHFKNHPQMIPFVGKYWGNYKKLLIIGESHYLPNSTPKKKIQKWYDLTSADLTEEECWWTSTSDLLNEVGVNQKYTSKGHSIWKNTELAMIESGFRPHDTINMFRYVAFMNFFQRPAEYTGESINPSIKDVEVANNTLRFVTKILKIQYLFFVSSKAWRYYTFKNNEDLIVGHSCHPSSQWWNRKSGTFSYATSKKKLTGKESFIRFLQENEIFDIQTA